MSIPPPRSTVNTLCRVVSCLSRTVQDGLDTEEARATDVELSVFRGYRRERQDVSLCRSILLLLLIVIIANSNSTSKARRVVVVNRWPGLCVVVVSALRII